MIANILWDDFVDVHIGQTLPLEHLHEAIVGDRVFSEIVIRRFTKPQKRTMVQGKMILEKFKNKIKPFDLIDYC